MCWKVDAAERHGLASTTVPTMPFGRVADTKQPYRAVCTAHSDQRSRPCVHRPFVMLIEAADLHNKTTHMDHSAALTSLNTSMIYFRAFHSSFCFSVFTVVVEGKQN